MPDLLKDILIGLGTSAFIERAPKIADSLIHLSCTMLPEELRDRYRHDWTSTVACIDGNLSKLGAAVQILVSVPAIRRAFGLAPISESTFIFLLAMSNMLMGAVLMIADFYFNGLTGKVAPDFLILWIPVMWLSFLSGLVLGIKLVWDAYKAGSFTRMIFTACGFILYISWFNPDLLLNQETAWASLSDSTILPTFLAGIAMMTHEKYFMRRVRR
ncbi:hypothetical protein [Deinococcus enclensis]|uniref:Uncharacterized protein n=1 Tax=Deinococcus enclensis TaxID=1049582 RepID=A0ABT9MIS6_9DEIO|nr:hypothetical protein [Deinococcus enclensis]MDP9766476.1 hypothetical protein [Deinococcus enclensis]